MNSVPRGWGRGWGSRHLRPSDPAQPRRACRDAATTMRRCGCGRGCSRCVRGMRRPWRTRSRLAESKRMPPSGVKASADAIVRQHREVVRNRAPTHLTRLPVALGLSRSGPGGLFRRSVQRRSLRDRRMKGRCPSYRNPWRRESPTGYAGSGFRAWKFGLAATNTEVQASSGVKPAGKRCQATWKQRSWWRRMMPICGSSTLNGCAGPDIGSGRRPMGPRLFPPCKRTGLICCCWISGCPS